MNDKVVIIQVCPPTAVPIGLAPTIIPLGLSPTVIPLKADIMQSSLDVYDGKYEVVPAVGGELVLETKHKVMANNVTVSEIPIIETSNTAGGTTVYIGKEIEIYGQ